MKCLFCHDTECLTPYGIFTVYLKPHIVILILMLLSMIAAFVLSPYILILTIVLFFLPLANADLRMYLYLPVLIAYFAGKRVNCPKCNPGGAVFRSSSPK